jgi:hypothetical protein
MINSSILPQRFLAFGVHLVLYLGPLELPDAVTGKMNQASREWKKGSGARTSSMVKMRDILYVRHILNH